MSAEDEKQDATPGDAPAEPAAKKPAAKKPAAKKPAAKAEKPAEGEPEQPTAEDGETAAVIAESPVEDEETAAVTAEPPVEGESPAKKPAKARRAKKAAPAADEQSAAQPVAEEAKESAPEPKPAAAKGKPAVRRQAVHARARYVRTSARKARMVCGHIRGKSVQEARAILAFTPRDAARDWSKLLESAVANAENNHELLEDDLIVREAYADEGPTIKRFRPRAMGRATPIRKRTSHLTITLTPRS